MIFVEQAIFNVTEADSGNSSLVTSCYNATIDQQLTEDIILVLSVSNTTTASISTDIYPNLTSYIIIPANFSGIFRTCINYTIIGDDVVEYDERVVFDLRTSSEHDLVIKFPGNATNLVINIIDNDGKL